uniref:Uncharacterized protein n=1 Tax=Oryza glaberrima TaxID=4538 RepID=I1R0R5_ORYGL
MNATVASPSENAATVTVASLDELREVAENDPRASEEGGLRVEVTGVRVSQAEELHALVRDRVEAKLWSVGVGEADAAMAALRSAADGAARLVELSRALDAVVRDTEDGVPVPATGPRVTLLRELARDVSAQRPPPFLPCRYAIAGADAVDIARQAKALSYHRFSGDRWTSPESLECSMDYFRRTVEKARARSAALLGMTIPFEDPPIVIHILEASSWEARYYSSSSERNV